MSAWPWLKDVTALSPQFDLFLVDQFGTLHDGQNPYPGALAGLAALRAAGRRVVVLSNSGRRAAPNAARLERIGFPPHAYDAFLTSGEVGWCLLRAGRIPEMAGARRCLLLTRDEDRAILDGLDLVEVGDATQAEFILLAGSEGERYPMAHYQRLLAAAATRGVPCLCLNPDRTMLAGGGFAFGAGSIADAYAAMGGKVIRIGKPHRAIYDMALAEHGGTAARRIIGIGDSIEHDVRGAKRAGLAAALVRAGIAADMDDETIAHAAATFEAAPDFILERF